LADTGFTIHTAFALPNPPADGFNTIVLFHNGNDRSQLLIGHWRQHLIVMNGDDYDHRRRTPRLTIDTSRMDTEQLLLTLTVNGVTQTASLYLNGLLEAFSETFELALPVGKQPARLVLGNSAHADSSFRGLLYSFAMYDQALHGEEVRRHYDLWQQGISWPVLGSVQPRLSYRFDDHSGRVLQDASEQQVLLEIPVHSTALERRLLVPPSADFELRRDSLFDFLANLLGFLPLGFLAAAAVWRTKRFGMYATLVLVTLMGGLLSLGIEYAQSWMPSRSSSLIDLFLNTAGATVGSALLLLGLYRSELASPGQKTVAADRRD
jgi:VanZ family protein